MRELAEAEWVGSMEAYRAKVTFDDRRHAARDAVLSLGDAYWELNASGHRVGKWRIEDLTWRQSGDSLIVSASDVHVVIELTDPVALRIAMQSLDSQPTYIELRTARSSDSLSATKHCELQLAQDDCRTISHTGVAESEAAVSMDIWDTRRVAPAAEEHGMQTTGERHSGSRLRQSSILNGIEAIAQAQLRWVQDAITDVLDRTRTIERSRLFRLLVATVNSRVAAFAGIATALSLVWLIPGWNMDFGYDWLSARAFVIGSDPFQPLQQLIDTTDTPTRLPARWEGTDLYHPRLPGAVLALSALAAIPWDAVYEAGRVLVVVATAALVWMCSRAAGLRPEPVLLFLPVIVASAPFVYALETGNTGILVAALIAATWFRKERFSSGVPLGVAVTLKVWPWLLVPALFISGRRRTAVGAGATVLALHLAAVAFPHVSLAASLVGIMQATWAHAPRSLGFVPVWASLAAGALFLILAWRRNLNARWAIPVALGIAPLIWPTYLPVLLVPLAEWRGVRADPKSRRLTASEPPVASVEPR